MDLRELLQSRALSPDDLIAATGKGQSTVYAWLAGRHAPNAWDQGKLARALDVSLDELREVLAETRRRRNE